MNTSNVAADEVAKFNALASRWWDEQGSFKTLHQINPLRLGFIEASLGNLQDLQIADIGCGGGILSEALCQAGAKVTAIDMAAAPLDVARLHTKTAGLDIDYQQMTAEALAEQQPQSFDAITCMELLEHVPDPGSLVQACAQLCKPGGKVFFSTLNRNLKSFLMAIVGAEYVMNILPKGTHSYAEFIRPSELSAWCRAAGLLPQQINGISYNPISQSFKLSDNVDINYLICCEKPES